MTKLRIKIKRIHNFLQEIPINSIKSFTYINLNCKITSKIFIVQHINNFRSKAYIVSNFSSLVGGYNVRHDIFESINKNLGDDFEKLVDIMLGINQLVLKNCITALKTFRLTISQYFFN